jgi:hypothetical protein
MEKIERIETILPHGSIKVEYLGGHSSRPDGAAPAWPKALAAEAYHGVAGEIVKVLEPYTEADPAAIPIQVLTCFGNVIGRGPHFHVEEDRHGLNLFTVLVGETSKRRKDVSFGRARKLIEQADLQWAESRIASGLIRSCIHKDTRSHFKTLYSGLNLR